jgi:signal transduction histidine kinase
MDGLVSRAKSALRSMTLATRAAVLVGCAFAVSFTFISGQALKQFEARYLDLVGSHQFVMLQALASRLDGNLQMAQTVLAGVAKASDSRLISKPDELQRFLDSRIFLHLSFDGGVRIHDQTGQLIVQSSPGHHPLVIPADEERRLISETLATGQGRVSAPFPASPTDRQPALAMCSPIFGNEGRVVGVMLASLYLLSPYYASELKTYRVGQGGYVFMTTHDRVMLMHPDPARLFKLAAQPGQNRGYDRVIETRFQGTTETVNSTGLNALASYARVPSTDWILGANFPLDEARQPFRQTLGAILWWFIAVALALTLGVGLMVHRLMHPIRQLTRHLLELGEGRARPFRARTSGEVHVLSNAYNQMLGQLEVSEEARREGERLIQQTNEGLERRVHERTLELEKAHAELVRSEKLAALGRLMAGLAHELSTPLGNALVVSGGMRESTDSLQAKVQQGGIKRSELDGYAVHCVEAVSLIERNLARAAKLVAGFKQAAVDQTAERRREFELKQTIEDVLATLEHLIRQRPIRLHLDMSENLRMDSFPGAIGQVVTNLFINALTHAFSAEDQGDLWISYRAVGDREVRLEIRDNGHGIVPEHVGKVFDPFFTTRLGSGGSGLGLYIVHNAVTGPLGGHIEVRSTVGQGTTFVVTLPRVAPATPARPVV